MIDLLATLVICQHVNYLEYKVVYPDCLAGHKPVIPQYNILVITHVLGFTLDLGDN